MNSQFENNETIRRIALIWSDILPVGPRNASDNFYALGGNSLMAMHVVVKVRRMFSCQISLTDLLGKPTLGEFSQTVEARLNP